MSLTIGCCSYVGCTNSYSKHKDITYFKFPDDTTRRNKWIKNCGDPLLSSLGDRQLRHKRVCAEHFPKSAFVNSEFRNALTDKAVPIPFVKSEPSESTTSDSTTKANQAQNDTKSTSKSRGRPRRSSASASAPPEVEEEQDKTPKAVEDNKAEKTATPASTPRSTRRSAASTKQPEAKEPEKPAGKKTPSKDPAEKKEESTPTPARGRGKPGRRKSSQSQIKETIASIFSKPKPSDTKSNESSKPKVAKKLDQPVEKEPPPSKKDSSPVKDATDADVKEKETSTKEKAEAEPVKTETPRRGRRRQTPEKPVAEAKPEESKKEDISKSKTPAVEKVVETTKTKQPTPPRQKTVTKPEPQSVTKVMDQMKEKAAAVFANPVRKNASTPTNQGTKQVEKKPIEKKPTEKKPAAKHSLDSAELPAAKKAKISPQEVSPKTKPVEKPPPTKVYGRSPLASDVKAKQPEVPQKVKPSTTSTVTVSSQPVVIKGTATKQGGITVVTVVNPSPKTKVAESAPTEAKKPSKAISTKTPIATLVSVGDVTKPSEAKTPEKTKAPGFPRGKKIIRTQFQADDKTIARKAMAGSKRSPDKSIKTEPVTPKKKSKFEDVENEKDTDEDTDENSNDPKSDGREFERFHCQLKKNIPLMETWGLGGVLWNPVCNSKVAVASEMDVTDMGEVRVKRAVEIFEDGSVKVLVDGVDLTEKFDVKIDNTVEDVKALIATVAIRKVCTGIAGFTKDDLLYFPDTTIRAGHFFAEDCEVISEESGFKIPSSTVCEPCAKIATILSSREEIAKAQEAKRKRPIIEEECRFGRELYSLLNEMLEESLGKAKSRRYRRYADEEYDDFDEMSIKKEKDDDFCVPSSFQDIVNRLGLKTSFKQEGKEATSRRGYDELVQVNSAHGNLVVPKAPDFALTEGEEYELLGEVDPDEVKVLEVVKHSDKDQSIEIIEIDDDTMAQMTFPTGDGEFVIQDPSNLQTSVIESSEHNLSQILKSFSG